MTTRHRSPNYPGIDLEEAVEGIKKVASQQGSSAFSIQEATKSWGYNSPSGPARVKFAALRQYGLVQQETDGNYRLSEEARILTQESPSLDAYNDAIREAAMRPVLFKELFQSIKAGTLIQADEDFSRHLLEKGFSIGAASRLIGIFRRTMRLANLELDLSRQQNSLSPSHPSDMRAPDHAPSPSNVVRLVLGEGEWFSLETSPGLSEESWSRMIGILEVLKPIVVGV